MLGSGKKPENMEENPQMGRAFKIPQTVPQAQDQNRDPGAVRWQHYKLHFLNEIIKD